jgi:hypothetical protein
MAMQHAAFIKQLGDTGVVADALGQKHSTVSMWKKREVPWRWRGAVARLAQNAEVAVPENFLGETE